MQRAVRDRLRAVGRSLSRHVWAVALLEAAAGWLIAMLLGLAADWLLELSRPVRVVWLVLATAGAVAWVVWRVRPVWGPMEPLGVASLLDDVEDSSRREGLLTHRVATVLQMPESADRRGWSAPLVEAAVRRAFRWLEGVRLDGRLANRRLARRGGALLGVVAVVGLITLLAPAVMQLWAQRWVLLQDAAWPQDTTLTVVGADDGVLRVPRGEPWTLRVAVEDQGEPTEAVRLWLEGEAVDDAMRGPLPMRRFAEGDFRLDMPPMATAATLRLRGGDDRLEAAVEPVDRPAVRSLMLGGSHPRGGAVEPVDLTSAGGRGSLLSHTRGELVLTSNVPVGEVRVLRDAEDGPGVVAFERVDATTWRADWEHLADVQTRLELRGAGDGGSGLTSRPVDISVAVREDQTPRVSLSFDGVGTRITQRAVVPLQVQARDDLGVVAVELLAGATAPSADALRPDMVEAADDDEAGVDDVQTLPLFEAGEGEVSERVDARLAIDVRALEPAVGDLVRLTAAADDAAYPETQRGESRQVVLRVVSDRELFREIKARMEALRAELRQVREQAEQLRAAMAEPNASEATRDDLARALRSLRSARREVRRLHQAIGDTAEQARLNRLTSLAEDGVPDASPPEADQRRLQVPLQIDADSVDDPSVQLLRQTVLEPMDRLYAGAMAQQQQALERLVASDDLEPRQRQIVQEMDAVLAALAQWDSFNDVLIQLNEIIRMQEQVADDTGRLMDEQVEGLFDD
jgi:hypothetical protein